jgi:hypothetical protein
MIRTQVQPWRSRVGASLGPAARLLAITAPLLALAAPPTIAGQDANLHLPVPLIEAHLRGDAFRILDWRGSRAIVDRTQRVAIAFEDSSVLLVKWANASPGASAFNNEPRYEAAAYDIQKLFLEPEDYVVPPTVLRSFPLAYVREQVPDVPATFSGVASVLVVLQYWLSMVEPTDVWDPARAESDLVYARHVGNLNVLTYLIRHGDSNIGNFLKSTFDGNPRVFAVDNGIAFRSPSGNRGTAWRDLRVKRLPRATVERLRTITRADLDECLAILAEYEIREGELVPVSPGANLGARSGVRQRDGRVQIGLTAAEIGDVAGRLRRLLDRVDRGQIELF